MGRLGPEVSAYGPSQTFCAQVWIMVVVTGIPCSPGHTRGPTVRQRGKPRDRGHRVRLVPDVRPQAVRDARATGVHVSDRLHDGTLDCDRETRPTERAHRSSSVMAVSVDSTWSSSVDPHHVAATTVQSAGSGP